MKQDQIGLKRQCPYCLKAFFVCTQCDRWHWYCSDECRVKARKTSLRKARIKYQRSEKGRINNLSCQKRFRRQRKSSQKKNVSHHSSQIKTETLVSSSKEIFFNQEKEINSNERDVDEIDCIGRCVVCGRPILFLRSEEAFPSYYTRKYGGLAR